MQSLHVAMAGVALCFVTELARAAEDGIYFGAASGQVETDDTLGLDEVYDDQDTVNRFILGYRPMDWFAIESNYFDLGAVTLDQNQPALAPFRLEQTGWNVYAVFLLELGGFDLYAKGGLVKSNADLTQAVGNSQASSVDTDTDVGWGLGAQYRFGKLAARIEYDEYNISNGDRFDFPKMVSVGITWTF